MLEARAIIAEAEDQAHVTDRDRSARHNLEMLVASLNRQANLSAHGEAMARRQLAGHFAQRLEGEHVFGAHPEIAEEVVAAPVFLMGLPRSGATYFQYLFDRDERFRLLRSWECAAPNPPAGADPEAAALRQAEWAQRNWREMPAFEGYDAVHIHELDGPDQCHALLEQSCGAAGLNNLFRVPAYFDYLLDEADLAATYRVHKRQLQLLQWRSERKPWALKYPNHMIALREILQVYPDARLVMTHRDPIQALGSIAAMTHRLRNERNDGQSDPAEVGRDMLHFLQRHIDRIMEFDDGEQGGRVIHVDYYALVDDPVMEMQRVHASLGIDTPVGMIQAMEEWRRANPQAGRAHERAALDAWGLDEGAVTEQFADYMSRFGIPPEQEALARLAG